MARRRKSQNNIEEDIMEFAVEADAEADGKALADAGHADESEDGDDLDYADESEDGDESDYAAESEDGDESGDATESEDDDDLDYAVESEDGDESDYAAESDYDDDLDYASAYYDDDESDDYDDVEDYFDDKPQKKRKSSQLDILDDDYIKENMMHKSGGKTVVLIIAWIIFAVLCASYVYVFFIRKDKEEKIPGKDNTVVLEIPDGANYSRCEIEEINQLINHYLLARVNCNQETLKTLVTDPSQFDDMTVLEQAAEYIIGYEETTCYIANGYDENGYIVIELSYLKISNVRSEPLDIMSFYVVKDADGGYKIDNSKLSVEVANYVSEVKATQNIQDIYIHVKENNDYLLDTDTTFADFYNLINK
ncbi:MAG: hypothetical protein J6L77_03165 [Coprococcus sp.]|nr:hypothetical protein [Coprococcus sp.]